MQKLIDEADQYCSGESLKPAAVLRLAAKLSRQQAKATRANVGLFEVARERILGHLLMQQNDDIRVVPGPEGKNQVAIRPPKGQRAPVAIIGLEKLPKQARIRCEEILGFSGENTMEYVPGLDVRPIDTTFLRLMGDMNANQCLKAGLEAEEEYDYERAIAGYRLAVVRSRGGIEEIRKLVDFLSNMYADYEEIADLLSSSAIDVTRHRDLHRQLADALFQVGDKEDAQHHYETLLDHRNDAHLLQRLGELALEAQSTDVALEYLQQSQKMAPDNHRTRELLDTCNAILGDQAEAVFQEAENQLKSGQREQALELLTANNEKYPRHAPTAERLKELLKENAQKDAEVLMAKAGTYLKQENWREALHCANRALDLDATLTEEATQFIAKAQQEILIQTCMEQCQIALSRQQDDDIEGALISFHRALETDQKPPGDLQKNTLLNCLQDYMTRHRVTDRAFEGLAAYYRSQNALDANHLSDSERYLNEAKRHLKKDQLVVMLSKQLNETLEKQRTEEVNRVLEQFEAAVLAQHPEEALQLLEKAEQLAGQELKRHSAQKVTLKEQLNSAAKKKRVEERLARLAKQNRWWRILRDAGTSTSPTAVEFVTKARQEISNHWSIATTGDAPVIACPPDVSNRALAGVTGQLRFAGWDNQLIVASPQTNNEARQFTLPEKMTLTRESSKLIACQNGFLLLNGANATVTRIALEGDAAQVADHISLKKHLPVVPNVFSDVAFSDENERLLCPIPHGKTESRLLSFSLDDGQIHNEERFSYRTFNIQAVQGDTEKRFTLQRALDLSRPTQRLYNFAIVDDRTKVLERIFYPELDEPMYAIRRVGRLSTPKAELLCQYQFMDPFGGQPVKDSYAFIQMKNDWSIFYQNSYPHSWLDDDALLCSPFAAHEPSDSLVMGWKQPGTDSVSGISVISIDRFRPKWSYTLAPNVAVVDCTSADDLKTCFVVLQTENGIQLKTVDMENQQLV